MHALMFDCGYPTKVVISMTRATAFTAIAVAALVAIAFRFAPGTLTVRVQRSGSESAVTLRVRPSSLSDLQASTASALGLRSVATLYDAASGTALADVGAVVACLLEP